MFEYLGEKKLWQRLPKSLLNEFGREAMAERVVGHLAVVPVLEDLEIAQLAEVVGGRRHAHLQDMRNVADAELVAGAQSVKYLQAGSVCECGEQDARLLKEFILGHRLPKPRDEVLFETRYIAEVIAYLRSYGSRSNVQTHLRMLTAVPYCVNRTNLGDHARSSATA